MSVPGVFGVPRIPDGTVRRDALLSALDEGSALTTVTAGSGFGKTTLLVEWAAARREPGAWIDAAAGGQDAASFWRFVFRVLVESGRVLDASIPADEELDDAGRRSSAIASFARSLEGPLLLVIDNAHVLDVADVGPDLVSFVRFARRSRLVVVDRRRRLRPASIASDVEETRLTGVDLLLTPEETAGLVAGRRPSGGKRASAEDAHRLGQGIVGLVRRIAESPASEATHHAGIVEDLVLPWAAETDAALTPDGDEDASEPASPTYISSAALMLAALGAATVEEAAHQAGLDVHAVTRALEEADERGLGRREGDGPMSRFVFAPIVVLSARYVLTNRLPVDERRRVAARIAQLYAVRGNPVEAFALAIDAEDFDLAVAIGKRSFLVLIRDDTPGLLRRLRRVPLTRLRKHPLLVLFIAMLHAQSRRGLAAALLHFRLAEQLARATERTSSPDDRAVMVGVRSAALRMQGRFDKSVPVAREFLDRFDRLTLEEQDRLSSLSRHLLWQVAHTLLFAGDGAAALAAAQRMLAVPAPTLDGEDRGIHPALTIMAATHAIAGDIPLAQEGLAEASTHPHRAAPFYHVWGRTAEAIIAIEGGDIADGVERIASLDHDMTSDEYWPVELVVRALGAVADGRIDDAVAAFDAVLSGSASPRQATATRDGVFALSAILSLAARPAGSAKAVLRHAADRGGLVVLVEALIALREGEAHKALSITGDALTPRPESPRLHVAALLLRSVAAARADQPQAARRAARDALLSMESHGIATPWLLLDVSERSEILALGSDDALPGPEVRAALERMPVLFREVARVERITEREREVLQRLVSGATIPEIASDFGVSPNTIKTQRSRIYRKLGVDNRSDAARVALEHDLL